jgi:hypothetical protein
LDDAVDRAVACREDDGERWDLQSHALGKRHTGHTGQVYVSQQNVNRF